MQAATDSIALLNELMSGQSTPDLLEEVAKQLMVNFFLFLSLLFLLT